MRFRSLVSPFAAAVAVLALNAVSPARADILINIDKSAQQMTVTVDGEQRYVWPVSTGAPGYDTPSGEFKPFRMERDHFSREWDDAPMPHSIFFSQKGHAIHGSNHVRAIGTPASHGCVRLEPKNAAILFALVRQQKMANTRVVLNGETPQNSAPVARRGNGNGNGNERNARDTSRSYSANDIVDDDDVTSTVPQQRSARGWREYHDGPRYYYYRERPYYVRRYYGYYGSPFPQRYGW